MKYFLFEDKSGGEAASSWWLAESSGRQWPPTRPDEKGRMFSMALGTLSQEYTQNSRPTKNEPSNCLKREYLNRDQCGHEPLRAARLTMPAIIRMKIGYYYSDYR